MDALEAVTYLLFCTYLFSFFGLTAWAAREAGRPVWLFKRGAEAQALPAMLFRLAFAGAAIWPIISLWAASWLPADPVQETLDGVILDLVGHSLVAIGACAAAASQMHMGSSWRIGAAKGEVGAIVSDGPFAISRNPVFLGQMLLFIGLFLVFPSIVQGGLTLALITAVHLQVRIEERVLLQTLGEPYRAYSASVSRWIGIKIS